MRASLLARVGSVAAAAVIAVTGAMATAGAAGAAIAPVRRLVHAPVDREAVGGPGQQARRGDSRSPELAPDPAS
jgi:hypothetical protein